jgi:nucleoside-diphosphate-sugar epimerase
MSSLLNFGHGYSASALTKRLVDFGWDVTGTTRNLGRFSEIQLSGATPILWSDNLSKLIGDSTHILVSGAPDAKGDPVIARFNDELAAAKHLVWVGYLSTTAVYGNHDGGWVNENTPLAPTTQRGQWRVQAEQDWLNLGLPIHIFRLAGIYGPGRGPFEKVRNGTARRIVKDGQVFSRIHVEDIAQVLMASMVKPNPGAIYNLCDDDPAPPNEVLAYAAELLGLPAPPEVALDDPSVTPMARSFYAESKRVRNDRIKSELGIKLLYPDYRAGLKALLALG